MPYYFYANPGAAPFVSGIYFKESFRFSGSKLSQTGGILRKYKKVSFGGLIFVCYVKETYYPVCMDHIQLT